MSWIFLRASHAPDRSVEIWRRCEDLLRAVLAHPEWRVRLEKLVRYSLVRGLATPDELRAELRDLAGPEAEEVAVTAGEKLLEQVREQGLVEGRREALRLLLLQRFKLTELPLSAEARVRDASQAEVEALLRDVLEADSLSDLFGS